jgi:hypothetical protein
MLEIFLYNETSEDYDIYIDLFGDTEIELTIPIFPTSNLSEKLIDYTDSFDLPATQRNLDNLDIQSVERFRCKIKSCGQSVNGYLSVNSIKYNTPESVISVNFVSLIKYVYDNLKDTGFWELFRSNSITGAELIENRNGVYINDGNFGFVINETIVDNMNQNALMSLTASNHFSSDYDNEMFPVYVLDSQMGSRSLLPTFNIEKLISAMFKHFGLDIGFDDNQIMDNFGYSDIHVKIPVNFYSKVLNDYDDDTDRTVEFSIDNDGKTSALTYNPIPNISGNYFQQNVIYDNKIYYTPQDVTEYDISGSGTINDMNISLFVEFQYDDDTADPNNPPTTVTVPIPSDKVSYTGQIRPVVVFYLYDEIINSVDIGDLDIFYNTENLDLAEINGFLSVKYGDALTAEIGVRLDAQISFPEEYDMQNGWSATEKTIYISKTVFQNFGLGSIDVNTDGVGEGIIGDGIVRAELDKGSSFSNKVTLTPSEEYQIARYGDKVIVEESYKEKKLTFHDVLESILLRFNLSIKEDEFNGLHLIREQSFYKPDSIIIDNKISGELEKDYLRNDSKTISFINKGYGNKPDRIYPESKDNKTLIYDVDKYVLDDSKNKDEKYEFKSTIQNDGVYGDRLKSSDIDNWDFLKLENDTALWNAASNAKN